MSAPNPGRRRPFGDLENKSMESVVTENKALDVFDAADDDTDEDDTDGATDAETPGADSDAPVAADVPAEPVDGLTRVVMIHHHSHGDLQLVPGVEYGLPDALASDLIDALRAVAAK